MVAKSKSSFGSLVGGCENKPEKVLSMIAPDFLSGISSSLTQLRQDTLQELGMIKESAPSSTQEPNNGVKPVYVFLYYWQNFMALFYLSICLLHSQVWGWRASAPEEEGKKRTSAPLGLVGLVP